MACDHYHRFRQDVAMMAMIGLRHYRLSIAWPRIYPDGDGSVNRRGLDFYQRLVDALLAKGVTPWITLCHWDLLQSLEDRGGWRSRTTVDAFARYTDTVVQALWDRVKHWFTLNEIICFTKLAYGVREKAPGTRESDAVVNQAFHHALLCHGGRAVREHGGRRTQLGLADAPEIPIPVTETERDIAAARELFVEDNIRVLDPIFRGRYAETFLRAAGPERPDVAPDDFALISQPADFLGLNIYKGYFARAGKKGRAERIPFPPQYPRTARDWLAHTPQAMYWGPRHAAEVYGARAIVITENGASFEDERPNTNGEILDVHRRDQVRNYPARAPSRRRRRVPVRGYFPWSLMDNFEWHDGYPKRLGIVHVDFDTQRRTPKLSAWWYREVMRSHGLRMKLPRRPVLR